MINDDLDHIVELVGLEGSNQGAIVDEEMPQNLKLKTSQQIIVADDCIVNMAILRHQLQKFGQSQNCSFCYDGEEALSKAISVLEIGL